jgi:hypothetical protein
MKNPRYLIANPVHSGFYKIPYQLETILYTDIFNEIKQSRVRVPLKIYTNLDISNPYSYNAPIIIKSDTTS